ncbi:hypothetical protein B0H17DRAFT_1192132 [Mycena rosella]|uniref:Cytoplasmic tRNA 2-thiolation protein 2 n=1 Tax=Mycena rosella TaxID=1033263 RepID=A0AAD7GY94_MYCRO|nr:hypothetical protein B0H17DRAFT_1192132 [Mycena rosella]
MASCGNPATEQDALMLRRTKFDKTRVCIKCRTNPGNVVIRHAVYCKECFFPMMSTKFRRTLEPSINAIPNGPRKKGLKPAGNLFLGFSGGLGSTVLLDLVSQCYFSNPTGEDAAKGGTDHPRNASVWKKATVCYVEMCNALPGTRDRTDEMRAAVEHYGHFDFLPLRIENAFDDAWWQKVGGQRPESHFNVDLANEELFMSAQPSPSSDSVASLRAYISSLPTQTAVPTAIQTLIRLLLLHTAWSTESSHLVLGTSLTSLSVSLISSISQGGGFVVREEAEEEWQPTVHVGSKRTVRVNRPLRDIGMKECAVWAWWHGLQVVGKESFLGGKQGIGALTKNFIVGLERDYPSTVSTIARTCGKLAPKDGSDTTCILCERPAQLGVQEWKARISIRSFDEPALASPPPHLQNVPSLPVPGPPDAAPPASLTPRLCYACHTTLTSRSSRGSTSSSLHANSTPLPMWVVSDLGQGGAHDHDSEQWRTRKMQERDMKESIAEFLLPDS